MASCQHSSNSPKSKEENLAGCEKLGPWLLGVTLGKGSFAVVRLGIHETTKQKVAIKFIRNSIRSTSQARRIEREVSILAMINHPNIVKLIDYYDTPLYYIVIMEYVSGTTLYRFLRKKFAERRSLDSNSYGGISAEMLFRIFHPLVSALEFCHQHGISHRDIKPENVLIEEGSGTLKIVDFGFARLSAHRQLLETRCGSPLYAAPELVRGEKYFGPAVDVWSLGVVLYAMMATGSLPFLHDDPMMVEMLISEALYQLPLDLDLQLQDVIERMMHPNLLQRISLASLKQHPWWLKQCQTYSLAPAGVSGGHLVVQSGSSSNNNASAAELDVLSISNRSSASMTTVATSATITTADALPGQVARVSGALALPSRSVSSLAVSDEAHSPSSSASPTSPLTRAFSSRISSFFSKVGEKLRGKPISDHLEKRKPWSPNGSVKRAPHQHPEEMTA